MRRTLFSNLSPFLLALVVLVAACSKEGPAGATGPAGPQGPAGPNGTQGPQGNPGTANVIYSAWLDVTFALTPDSSAFRAIITADKIDAAILNSGVVKVYWNVNTTATPVIVPLPYFDGGLIINYVSSVGRITLISSDNVSTVTPPGEAKVQQYRYVLIPGGTAARSGVDLNDYKQVQEAYNIPD